MDQRRHRGVVAGTRRGRWSLLAVVVMLAPLFGVAAPGAGAAQDVTLDLLIFEGEETFLPTATEEFAKRNPNVKIEVTEIPEDQYVTKIDTLLAADDPPDIAYVYERRWIKAGRVLPLDEMVQTRGINMADFNAGAMTACNVDERVYCVGTQVGNGVLVYNKEMFDAAGAAYPSATEPMTVDEFAALAAQLSNDEENIEQKVWGGFAGPSYAWTDPRYYFSEDGRTVEGHFDDEATIHAYDVLARMIRDGHAPGSAAAAAFGEDVNLFVQKKQAMALNWVSPLALEEAGLNFGVAPLPVEKEGDQTWVPSWTDALGVFSGSEHPQEAMEFLAFMATDGQALRAATEGTIPVDRKAAEQVNWTAGNPAREQYLQVVNAARPGLFVPSFWDVVGQVDDPFNIVVEEGGAMDEAIGSVMPDMQDTLDRNWETFDAVEAG